jgi:hypothetical protein
MLPFDGHALVVSNGDQFGEIFVDGFKTVPSGPVKIDVLMASEGDDCHWGLFKIRIIP